jgi:hypothetical protein
MSKTITVIKKCTGLNTMRNPLQPHEEEQGKEFICNLATAVDVVISDTLKIETAPAYINVASLPEAHSFFCDGGEAIVCGDDGMHCFTESGQLSSVIRSGLSGDKIDYTQVGSAIYYSNPFENGIVENSTNYAWDVEQHPLLPTDRQYLDTVPLLHHIEEFNGTILGSIDNAVYASEYGYPGLWCMDAILVLPTKITMLASVGPGIFISDEKTIWWCSGTNPREFIFTKISDFPALEWSKAHSMVDMSIFTESQGFGRVWSSKNGVCVGTPSGNIINTTVGKIRLPANITSGSSLIMEANIITTMR